jgi:hypothetical protein
MIWLLYNWYLLDRKLCGSQHQSGHGGEEKKPFPSPARNQTLIIQP